MVDRRRSLGDSHTRMVSQLHQLLLELVPGGAKKDLCARLARALLAKVRPRHVVGKTRDAEVFGVRWVQHPARAAHRPTIARWY